jgi:Lon protease-like protein
MNTETTTITEQDLPGILPVFPLGGVLLLPRGHLPLNVFENRYKAMVDDALRTHRMIGIIQPRMMGSDDSHALFHTGCAGRIIAFKETDDHRYEITLRGISRFNIARELPLTRPGYRTVEPNWTAFQSDLGPADTLNIDRDKLKTLLRSYFDMEGMECSWAAVDNATDDKLITCLSMVCPLDAREKQALLEAACCKSRAEMFMALLEMAVRDGLTPRTDHNQRH